MRYSVLVSLVFWAGLTYAEQELPPNCKPIAGQETSIILGAKQSVIIVVHNQSTVDLWITHPPLEIGLNQGSSSTHLEPGSWSALVLDKETFELQCVESRPGHEQQVPCTELIEACEWTSVTIPEKFKGTFWVLENISIKEMHSNLGIKGFILPAST